MIARLGTRSPAPARVDSAGVEQRRLASLINWIYGVQFPASQPRFNYSNPNHFYMDEEQVVPAAEEVAAPESVEAPVEAAASEEAPAEEAVAAEGSEE